jgi:hypothetical protein
LGERDAPAPEDVRAAGSEPVVSQVAKTRLGAHGFVSGEIPRPTACGNGLPGLAGRDGPGDAWKSDPWISDERFLAVHGRHPAGFEHCYVLPSRCTGWRAVTSRVDAFGEDLLVPDAEGKWIAFGA